VDSHLHAGARVPPYYDSLVAKIVAHGGTRGEALRRLRQALAETKLEGISSNLPLLRWVLENSIVSAGGFDIHHLERLLAERRDG
jgi:acetyl-CoA carboxylase biotin carboxylase subunit